MKILNLYAGIGGNRKLWGDKHEVTAVELNPKIAQIYKDFFPNDNVIVADAHQYLLEHYKEFDFIWASPPCPTHSKLRQFHRDKPIYPDMKLYEEIIFLSEFFEGVWVVENVISYYEPLIKPYWLNGHYFWSNFVIPEKKGNFKRGITDFTNAMHIKKLGFDLSKYSNIDKKKAYRNCVEPETALFIFNIAFKERQKVLVI